MTITYPIDFPTSFGASTFSIGLDHAVGVTESEFTFEQQVQEHQGQAWRVNVTLELLNRAQAEEYNAFILKLFGRVGTFTMTVHGSETARGSAGGTPLVNGASQTGKTLDIDGLPLTTNGVYLAGDWFQTGSGSTTKLHRILNDVNSNGAGEATLDIAPKIVTALADNTPIITDSPKGLFRLLTNLNPVNIAPPNQHTISFSAREVL